LKNAFIPTIQLAPKIAAKALYHSIDSLPQFPLYQGAEEILSQRASLLSSPGYGNFLSASLMLSSPFYALHDLFAFAVASQSQFVNFLSAHLHAETSRWIRQPAAMNSALEPLRRHKVLLIAHRQQTNNTLNVMRRQGPSGWARFVTSRLVVTQPGSSTQGQIPQSRNRQTSGYSGNEVPPASFEDTSADLAATQLLRDYEDLLECTDALILAYSEGIKDIHTSAMLLESRKAIGVAPLT
jgi:hypothetical protein